MPLKGCVFIKSAYILLEALIGFSVFFLLLAIYLPAFYQGYQRHQDKNIELEDMRIFKELVNIYFNSDLKVEEKINDYQAIHERQIDEFSCNSQRCYLSIENYHYEIELIEIE